MHERPFRLRSVAFGIASTAVSLALLAGRAGASDPSPFALEWQGPAECQAAPRVRSGVKKLLGGGGGRDASLVARARVERVGKRWRLVLATERGGRSAVRELDAESCDAAADAAAVILALLLDPARGVEAEEEDRDAAAPPPADAGGERDGARASEPRAAPPAPPPPSPPPPSPPLEDAGEPGASPLSLFAAAVTDTGTLPRTGFGVAGGLGLGGERLRLEATVAYWPSVSKLLDARAGSGGSFTLFSGTLRACALVEAGAFSFGPCAGGGLVRMRAEAYGVTTPIAATPVWGVFVADAVARVRISPYLSPRLSAGAAVPFSRPVFEVEGLGPVHQPAAIALQIAAGLEAHF